MLALLFSGPNLFDAVVLAICIISSILASSLPVTHIRYLGKTVGEKRPFTDFMKNLFSVMFFIFEALLMLRSAVAAAFSMSIVVFLLYMAVSGILFAVTLTLWRRKSKKFSEKHKADISRVANENPIFQKCIEQWRTAPNNNAIFILDDRIVISNENVDNSLFDFVDVQLNDPVSSKKESQQISDRYADNWKKQWCVDFINSHNSSETILFSTLGYDLISEESQRQLAEEIQNRLQLNMQTVRRRFSHRYVSSGVGFAGMGETFHAYSDSDVYSSSAVKTAAYVVYRSSPSPKNDEKSTLVQW